MSTKSITKIVYRFEDASVPPQYHRSYSITVTQTSAEIVVDSYGDILASKKYNITKEKFEEIRQAIQTCKIAGKKYRENNGCTGGKTEKVSFFDEKELFSGWIYHCGSESSGNLSGDIKNFASLIKKLIPDLNLLLE